MIGEWVSCVPLALISFSSHPLMALPKFDATLDTWMASPLALARVVNCTRERDTLGAGGTGLTCNISTDENALSTSISTVKARTTNTRRGGGITLGNAEDRSVEQQA